MKRVGSVEWVSGPVVRAALLEPLQMMELTFVGEDKIVGEVIELAGEHATLQVYESTVGLAPGAPVYGSGLPLHVELGPGLLGSIFDGIQRPLDVLRAQGADFIHRGVQARSLDPTRTWNFEPTLQRGATVAGGSQLGTVPESSTVQHRILVPPDLSGVLTETVPAGSYTIDQVIARIRTGDGEERDLTLSHRWPVRRPRPVLERLALGVPLITGQRIIDALFPLAKGGTTAIPGGFGTGKTVTQQNLVKWADADVIVYVGCGERGNEMTGVLTDLPKLEDPRTGEPLIRRTVLVANTSDMPVAAREASIYTGITIAEYYRDMGYDVALMADSTSRWAEALREISGRLEEMPAEEGFPAYLATRLAEFYERAGRVRTLNGGMGSVTAIGAVSPPGGDFSEPVTLHTKRFVRCFWELDKDLASARIFPAINTADSYSDYAADVADWWRESGLGDWATLAAQCRELLQSSRKLEQVAALVGEEALPDEERIALEGARLVREAFLQQDAFDPVDRFSSPMKTVSMLRLVIQWLTRARDAVRRRIPVYRIRSLPTRGILLRMRFEIAGEEGEAFEQRRRQIDASFDQLLREEGQLPAVPVIAG
jgi:V/A-type H+/Na+-transporting ATPase subunit A